MERFKYYPSKIKIYNYPLFTSGKKCNWAGQAEPIKSPKFELC